MLFTNQNRTNFCNRLFNLFFYLYENLFFSENKNKKVCMIFIQLYRSLFFR